MAGVTCRACRAQTGELVLDLGDQPACDYFPRRDDPGPDPCYPLQMWLCSACGLAQLAADATVPEEPRGAEPAALVRQSADAIQRAAGAGLLLAGMSVAEYGSPHGGSWLGQLADRGLKPVEGTAPADVVLDCFGLMHAPDQFAALAERTARVRPGGMLLLQYHSLAAILPQGQWNALRHGHYAYYSATALTAMLAAHGFAPRIAWHFSLYGGTVLLAATRNTSPLPTEAVQTLLAEEARIGIRDPAALTSLQRDALAQAKALHDWLAASHSAGKTVLGYGAASRAVALLCRANVDRTLLPAIADASPAKQGRRMPGTNIPVVPPDELTRTRPDTVLLFLPDLLPEVRAAHPHIEASGAHWLNPATL